jgi:hypothetical protein
MVFILRPHLLNLKTSLMKKNLILYSCLALLLGACKKDHDDNTSHAANTWTFKGTTYKTEMVSYVNSGIHGTLFAGATGGTATSADGIYFTFTPAPTSSVQMLITNSGDPNTVMVEITKLVGVSSTNYRNAETDVQATVSINSGKVSITFPGTIWLHNMSNYPDSAQLSVGTITQQ